MSDIDTTYLRKLVATEQMDGEAFVSLIDEYERLRAQVADLTRIAGCVAVASAVEVPVKTFDDIKREIKKNA